MGIIKLNKNNLFYEKFIYFYTYLVKKVYENENIILYPLINQLILLIYHNSVYIN